MVKVPFELEGVEPLKLIGTGGFGEVWLSRQTNIDRKVAVKVGHAPIDDETLQIRFERECIALGRLSGHPNIVDVFTAGLLQDGRPYLMLEYVGGGTLWQRLHREKLGEVALSRIGVELAAALSVAHTAGVLHRDLKPENVLLRPDGEAVLGDFGIARLHDSDNTTTQAITASVAYASPEVLAGNPATMATDLYGIGICLLTTATQAVPFLKKADESVHPIINRVLSERPASLAEHGFSPGFSDVVSLLLNKKPEDRPLSADVVHEMLVPFTTPTEPEPETGSALAATTSAEHDLPARTEPQVAVEPEADTAPARVSQPVRAAVPGSFRSSDSLATDLAAAADDAKGRSTRSRSDVIRLLGAVFGALMLLGGLGVFAVNEFTAYSLPIGSSEATAAGEEQRATSTTALSPSTTTEAPAPDPEPLQLPLGPGDTDLAAGASVEPDDAGPRSSQFCDVIPTTSGLVEWEGETLGDPIGYPLVFQQLARFSTPDEASSYLNTYLPSPSCTEWTIAAPDDDSAIVLEPTSVAPATSYGDENGEVVFEGTSGGTDLHGRVAIVRSGELVYTLSINSLNESDLDSLDALFELAVARLDF